MSPEDERYQYNSRVKPGQILDLKQQTMLRELEEGLVADTADREYGDRPSQKKGVNVGKEDCGCSLSPGLGRIYADP